MATKTKDSTESRFSKLVIELCNKGFLYKVDNEMAWIDYNDFRIRMFEFFSVLGMRVVKDEAEGYIYIYPKDKDEGEMPCITRKYQLGFYTSVLLAQLRLKLHEFEADGEGTRLFLTKNEIFELMSPYFSKDVSESEPQRKIKESLNTIEEMRLIKKIDARDDKDAVKYEVKRGIKAVANMEYIETLKERLSEYKKLVTEGAIA